MSEALEELGLFADRFRHFMNLWTIYSDLLTKRYTPSLDDDEWPVRTTMMFVVYSYFYSLVEDSKDGMNGFRVWRKSLPEEAAVISAVEAKVKPLLQHLRLFRNRLGFHGSRTRTRESEAFAIFNEHSGTQIFETIELFKAMSGALFGMATVLQENDEDGKKKYRKKLDEIAKRAVQL